MTAQVEVHEHLESAQRLLGVGELTAALDALLRAWRLAKCEPIVQSLTKLGALVDKALPPIDGKTVARRHDQWLEIATADAASDIDRLMVHVLEGTSRQIAERCKELARREADPRVARRLVELVIHPPWTATSADIAWTQVFKVLRQARDPGTRRALEGWTAPRAPKHSRASPDRHAENIAKVLALLDAEPEADTRTTELLAAIDRKIASLSEAPVVMQPSQPTSRPDREIEVGLLAEAIAAFDDDQPRHVLADFWLQRNDPRGELMALQLKRTTLTNAEAKRLKAILKEPRRLMGELAPVVKLDTLTFQRGLLWGCSARFRNKEERAKLSKHVGWAPLRELSCQEATLALVGSAPGLRKLTTTTRALGALLQHDQPLMLEDLFIQDFDPGSLVTSQVDRTSSLAGLKKLTLRWSTQFSNVLVPPSPISWLLGSRLAANLTELAVHSPWGIMPDLGAWFDVFSRLGTKQLDLVIHGLQLENIRCSGGRYSFRIRVPAHMQQNVLQAFASLPPEEVESLEIVVWGGTQSPALSALRERYAHALG